MSLPTYAYGPGPATGYGRPTLEGLDIGSPHHQRHLSHEQYLGSGPSSPAMTSPGHMYPPPAPHLQHLQPFAPPPQGMLPRMGVFHEPIAAAAPVVAGRAARGGKRGSTRKQAGSQPATVIPAPTGILPAPATPTTSGRKPASRDSKRRATHSQIERRRREKINDRLITLRNLVPACAKEVEERKRKAAGLDADGTPLEATVGEDGKKKRVRRKTVPPPKEDANGEEELGLHKLEVLTHAIDYIYELQARIEELQTGAKPKLVRRASDADRERDQAAVAVDAAMDGAAPPSAASQAVPEEDEEDELEMDDWKGVQPHVRGKAQDHSEVASGSTWDTRLPPSSQGHPSISSGSALPVRPTSSLSPPSSVLPLKADPMVSSFRASRRSSPSVMSLTADSPMLSPFASALLAHNGLTMPSPLTVPSAGPGSSSSAFTQLTSPVMSMGAESPIFKGSIPNMGGPDGGATLTSAPGPSGSRRASIVGKQAWPMLPSSALPLPPPSSAAPGLSTTRKRDSVASSSATEPKRVKRESAQDSPPETASSSSRASSSSSGSSQAPPARSDAELLLSFSTSPEALRPLSAVRESVSAAGQASSNPVPGLSRPTNLSPGDSSARSTAGGATELDGAAPRRNRGTSLEPRVSAIAESASTPVSSCHSKPVSSNEQAEDKTLTQSAPGGAWATAPSGPLNSPPYLALDGPASWRAGGDGKPESPGEAPSSCKPELEGNADRTPQSKSSNDEGEAA